MNVLDIIFIVIGVLFVALFTYERMTRALFSLILLWLVTFVLLFIYEWAGGLLHEAFKGPEPKAEAIAFLILLFVFFLIGYLVLRAIMPDTTLPKIGFLDYLMGALVGALFALVLISIVSNVVGFMLSEPWKNSQESWIRWRSNYQLSMFRPYTTELFNIYRMTYSPFLRQYPPVLVNY